MVLADHLPVLVSAVGLGLIAFVAVPAASSTFLLSRLHKPVRQEEHRDWYEDEDGVATEESHRKYSATVPLVIALAGCLLGLSVSIASSVISTLLSRKNEMIEGWVTVGSWALLATQTLNLFRERLPVRRYNLGIQAAAALSILIITLGLEGALHVSRPLALSRDGLYLALNATELATAALSICACVCIPRRPSVFHRGRAVDKQYTISAINRWTWAWASEYLTLARVKRSLVVEDVPTLHYGMRSKNLQSRFSSMKQRSKLWNTLLVAHRFEIAKQWLLSLAQGIVQFAPQLAMYKLLILLEARSEGVPVAKIAWAWVSSLGLSIIVAAWMETEMHWLALANLGLPIRTELSALIFAKSMRRKDVKETSKKSSSESPVQSEKPKEDVPKSQQSTINLIAVDVKRIADLATFQFIFSQTVAKLGASMVFLIHLIGWKSLLAGLAVSALTTPLNIVASRCYSKSQVELMTARDRKMAVITEALQGIRQIKFSALERQWQARIRDRREEELAAQKKTFLWDVVLITVWILGPLLLSAVSLSLYAVIHGDLTPSIAFTTITIFSQIEAVLAIIPELTVEGLEAWISAKRIGEYLEAKEKYDYTLSDPEITFENASIAWPSDTEDDDPEKFVLRSLNLRLPMKELSVVSGRTGTGKTLLLASILGEAELISGVIKVPKAPSADERHDAKANEHNWIIDSAIAYVAQIPWIENTTIRENVLFGLPFQVDRYNKVIATCALAKDLDMLPDGELTDIGANGINLSGGQRWRISFARALYSRAGILILDDIFSAVDAHVGRHLFEEALTGDLGQGRTRILVTHHVNLCLPKTKYSVLLGGGTLEHAGFVEQLRRTDTLKKALDQSENTQKKEEVKDETQLTELGEADGDTLQRILRRATEISIVDGSRELDATSKVQPKIFTEEEKRETGSIKFGVYKEYMESSGGLLAWLPILLMFLGHQALTLGRSWWISLWTRSYNKPSEYLILQQAIPIRLGSLLNNIDSNDPTHTNLNLSFYLGSYIGISVIMCISGTVRYLLVLLGSLRASRALFEKLTYTVLRTPLRWLDTVPVGRILNRFTADFAVVDSRMGIDFAFMIYQNIQVIGIIAAGIFVSPYVLLFSLLLLLLSVFIAIRFLPGAREIKRLESNAKSPIFERFRSALSGIGTIRSFGRSDAYIERMYDDIDAHARVYWYLWLFNRWMAIRLNAVGAVFAVLVAAIIVLTEIDASLAGFALSFALQYSAAVTWAIRQYANVELAMNATERIIEYARLPTEDQPKQDSVGEAARGALMTVPAAWPTEGILEIKGLVAGYAPDLPPVLRGLTFNVAKNQRIGVVGRTGAGKSSLTLALFRFLEAREGSIRIDGVDISKISLYDLRSRLAIIPQDPVLFSGTVRSNLDPFDHHTDFELYDALKRVHLIGGANFPSEAGALPATLDANLNIFKSLSSHISEGGLNISQGQRQLLCLARAIVSRPKIMVLDEATSAVDMATDTLIQRSIREDFQDSTLLVIAHRLSTIADFDNILVISDGKAVEFDTPTNLINSRGMFWSMIEQSGEREKLEAIIRGIDTGDREEAD